jgi:hypothetical protein
MIWYSKHQVSNQIEENLCSGKTECSSFQPMCSAKICSIEPGSAKPDGPISETGGSAISRNSDNSSETMIVEPDDWMTPLVHYLENLAHIVNRKVWH